MSMVNEKDTSVAVHSEKVVLIFDRSGSMSEEDYYPTRLDGVKRAGEAFIDAKLMQYSNDELAIVSFGDSARIEHHIIGLKDGSGSLKRALRLIDISGGTNVTSGLELAEKELRMRGAKRLRPSGGFFSCVSNMLYGVPGPEDAGNSAARRAVLLTDGHHNRGKSPRGISRRMKDAGIVIECIGIGGSPGDVDEKLLRDIASKDQSGGPRYWFISDSAQLTKKYEQLAGRLRV